METPIDLGRWPRRTHFEFFRSFEQPFWNVTARVDVSSRIRAGGRPLGRSFFLECAYAALAAANSLPELRYRLRGDGVVEHDVIHGGTTVLMPDETFRFGYFDYHPNFATFAPAAAAALDAVRSQAGPLDARRDTDDLIHFSVLPWTAFTSFQHARRRDPNDSVPKIVFGKYERRKIQDELPVSIEVHHALVDGLHVGRFFERLQARLASAFPAW